MSDWKTENEMMVAVPSVDGVTVDVPKGLDAESVSSMLRRLKVEDFPGYHASRVSGRESTGMTVTVGFNRELTDGQRQGIKLMLMCALMSEYEWKRTEYLYRT